MNWTKATLLTPLLRYAERLRFPWLFLITAALFVVDLIVPDIIPFADEVLLGFGTLLLGSLLKRRKQAKTPPSKSVDSAK